MEEKKHSLCDSLHGQKRFLELLHIYACFGVAFRCVFLQFLSKEGLVFRLEFGKPLPSWFAAGVSVSYVFGLLDVGSLQLVLD
jgi:hypothetical protein